MTAMAATVSDEDLADVADYFASQKRMEGSSTGDNPIGKKLFFNNNISGVGLACVNCHGERGRGLEPQISVFPIIGGQHKDYIRQQLIDFRNGSRTNSPNGMMNRMARTLTDAEIESLAEYVSQQSARPTESTRMPGGQQGRTDKIRSR